MLNIPCIRGVSIPKATRSATPNTQLPIPPPKKRGKKGNSYGSEKEVKEEPAYENNIFHAQRS